MRIAKAKQFEKQYKKLPVKIQKQCAKRLMLFLTTPYSTCIVSKEITPDSGAFT